MNTSDIPEQTVSNVIVQAILANNSVKPPEVDNKYRYYHCHLYGTGLKCKRVEGPHTMPSDEWTKLLFVKTYIPERLDKHILKYQWIPDRVIIEDKST